MQRDQSEIDLVRFEKEVKELEKDTQNFNLSHFLGDNKQQVTANQVILSLLTRNLSLIHQFNSLINSSTHQKKISNYDQERFLNKLKQLESDIHKFQAELKNSSQANNSKLDDNCEVKPTKFRFKKSTTNQNPGESVPISTVTTPSRLQTTSIETIQSSSTVNPFGLDANSQFILCRPSQPLQPLHSLCLSDLSNLVIDLNQLAPLLSSLHLSHINYLALLAPPLAGSASLNHVSHSLICLVSQQFRAYQSSDLVLLIYTTTNPVIEHSTRIRIGPFPEDILFPIMDRSISKTSQHHLVKDFDFPNATSSSSKNFSILSSSPHSKQDLLDLFSSHQVTLSSMIDEKLDAPENHSKSCFHLSDQAKSILINL